MNAASPTVPLSSILMSTASAPALPAVADADFQHALEAAQTALPGVKPVKLASVTIAQPGTVAADAIPQETLPGANEPEQASSPAVLAAMIARDDSDVSGSSSRVQDDISAALRSGDGAVATRAATKASGLATRKDVSTSGTIDPAAAAALSARAGASDTVATPVSGVLVAATLEPVFANAAVAGAASSGVAAASGAAGSIATASVGTASVSAAFGVAASGATGVIDAVAGGGVGSPMAGKTVAPRSGQSVKGTDFVASDRGAGVDVASSPGSEQSATSATSSTSRMTSPLDAGAPVAASAGAVASSAEASTVAIGSAVDTLPLSQQVSSSASPLPPSAGPLSPMAAAVARGPASTGDVTAPSPAGSSTSEVAPGEASSGTMPSTASDRLAAAQWSPPSPGGAVQAGRAVRQTDQLRSNSATSLRPAGASAGGSAQGAGRTQVASPVTGGSAATEAVPSSPVARAPAVPERTAVAAAADPQAFVVAADGGATASKAAAEPRTGHPAAEQTATSGAPSGTQAVAPSALAGVSLSGGAALSAAPTAAAPAAHTLGVGTTSPAQQLGPTLLTMTQSQDGARSMTVRLTPAELGMVQVQIARSADGAAQVTITAERPETLQLLQQDQAGLRQTLDQAGVAAEGRTISFHVGTVGVAASSNGQAGNESTGNGSGNFNTPHGQSQSQSQSQSSSAHPNDGGSGYPAREHAGYQSSRRVAQQSGQTVSENETIPSRGLRAGLDITA